jgi:hypothetical protein
MKGLSFRTDVLHAPWNRTGGYVMAYVIAARDLVIWRTRPGAGRSYVGNVRRYDKKKRRT